MSYPDTSLDGLALAWPCLMEIDSEAARQLDIEAKYAVYLDRQKLEISRARHDESVQIPQDFEYGNVQGLSNEVRLRLGDVRPESLGQASRVEGVTPVAITLLAVHLHKHQRLLAAAK